MYLDGIDSLGDDDVCVVCKCVVWFVDVLVE